MLYTSLCIRYGLLCSRVDRYTYIGVLFFVYQGQCIVCTTLLSLYRHVFLFDSFLSFCAGGAGVPVVSMVSDWTVWAYTCTHVCLCMRAGTASFLKLASSL